MVELSARISTQQVARLAAAPRFHFTRVHRSIALLLLVLACCAGPFAQVAYATITLDQFVTNTMGQQLSNAAGTYPGECVSLVSQYLLQVHGINNTGWNANAVDYQAGSTGGNKLAANGFTWSTDQTFANGDILVWNGTSGHVAVWYNGKIYDQNYNGRRTAGLDPYGAANFLGHWRKGTIDPHYNPIAPGDPGFTSGGNGWYNIGGGVYGTGRFTYGNNSARDAWGRWTFDLSRLSGTARYKVEAYVTSIHAGHTAVDYHINSRGGLQHVELNQNGYSNQWVDLGTYVLDAGSAWVELDDYTRLPWVNSAADQICLDGMKLTYVGPSNQAPIAVADTYTATEDALLTVGAPGVLSNDTDADGNPLTASVVTGVAHGTVSLAANGALTYAPAANYNGPDSFTYRVYDGTAYSSAVTVSITVAAVNDAPVAIAESYIATEDASLTVGAPGVLSNDTDADGDPLTASVVTDVVHGTLSLAANGGLSYTPAANYNGPDSFTYRTHDGTAYSNTATVSITVAAVNDAPIALAESYTATEDATLTVGAPGVLSNDTDADGNPLTAGVVTDVAHGTLSLAANGGFTYTAALAYVGADSFTYRVYDGTAYSATVTVSITVTPSGNGTPSTPAPIPTLRHGKSFTVSGYIVRHAAGASPVTLQFYRLRAGRWVLGKSTSAKVSNVLTFSTYSDSASVPSSGKWRVRARHKVGSRYRYSGFRVFTAK